MAKLVIKTDGLPAEVIKLKSGRNRFGRSSENDFLIQHPTISRFHCEIDVRDDRMVVRDLDSSNGTFVNGQPVGIALLESGQMLRLGDVQMEVEDAPKSSGEPKALLCSNHASHPASMKCTQCHRLFCGACVHILKRTTGKVLRLCPACSGHCMPLEGMNQEPKKFMTSLFRKLLRKPPEDKPFHD